MVAQIDSKGRLYIPKAMRKNLPKKYTSLGSMRGSS